MTTVSSSIPSRRAIVALIALGLAAGLIAFLLWFRPTEPTRPPTPPTHEQLAREFPSRPVQPSRRATREDDREEAPVSGPLPQNLRGRVIDADGQPVAKAVIAPRVDAGIALRRDSLSFVVASNDGGLFTLPTPSSPPAGIICDADGLLPKSMTWDDFVRDAATERGCDIVLESGTSIGGRVVDVWGNAVSGAVVEARARYGADLWVDSAGVPSSKSLGDRKSSTSDDNGAFTIRGLKGLPVTIRVFKPGFVLYGAPPVARESGREVTLTLHALGRLRVRLIDSQTRSVVSFARCDFHTSSGLDIGGYEMGTRPAGQLADGFDAQSGDRWFTFRATASSVSKHEATAHFRFVAVGYEDLGVDLPVRWPGEPGFGDATILEMTPTCDATQRGTLAISFTCPGNADRLKRATIFVRRAESGDLATPMQLSLDQSLHAEALLPPGDYDVVVGAPPGWSSYRSSPTPERVSIRPGQKTEFTRQLDVAIIRVLVRDTIGSPIPYFDASIRVSGPGRQMMNNFPMDYVLKGDEFSDYRQSMNAGLGDVEIPVVPGKHLVVVSKLGFDPAMEELDLQAGELREVRIALSETK